MKRIFVLIILLLALGLMGGCAPGTFQNQNRTDVYQQDPDGRTSRSTIVQTQDITGSANANMAGMAAGVAGNIANNAADIGMRTNFGQGFPADRQLLNGWGTNMVIPQMMGNGGFGYGGGNNIGFW